jgi:soluble lytic murein transglycosylase-like protein
MPATGRQYGALDLFDPKVNLDAGIQHLKKLLARYDLPLALAAYNAGEAAVDRFGGVPPFKETQNYVTRILRLLNRS